MDKPTPHCGTQVHPFILVPHREVLTLCLSAALKHFLEKEYRSRGNQGVPLERRGGREAGRMFMCWRKGSFRIALSGSLCQADTHDHEHTHTDTRIGRSRADLTHTHEHKYHSDQKPVRADRGPAPGWDPCPPCLSAQVSHRPGFPDALG